MERRHHAIGRSSTRLAVTMLVLALAALGLADVPGGHRADAAPLAPTAASGGFVGVTPFRLLDTRTTGGCVTQAAPRRLVVAGVEGSNVPAGVAAVALNVTVVAPAVPGFLTVYPAGVTRPTASSLNYVVGQVIPNNVIVKTGAADAIDVYASGGCPNVIVDIVGYFSAGTASAGGFTGVTPFRVVDTRESGGCVTQSAPRRVQVGGVLGSNVPAGVAAVALNVTVVAPSIPGYLTVYPAGVTRPTASTLNYVAGQVIPNGTVVKLGASDSIDVYASGGCPNVIVDVVGYFATGTPTLGGAFSGVTPYRLLDSRTAGGCVAQASPRRVQVAGVAGSGVPAGVGAVALNVTVVSPSIPGYVTVYPASVGRPTASTLNYVAGDVIPNGALVKVGASDSIDIYASGGCPNVIVDVVGYFLVDDTPTQVSAGTSHTCAALQSGSVRCWGKNATGQLGNNSTTNSSAPVRVAGLVNAVQVSAGENHSCAARDDGLVSCWGSNSNGELGNGTLTSSLVPVTVSGISTAVAVSTGLDFSCALLADGSGRCWGENDRGQVGNDGTVDSPGPVKTPAAVVGLSGAVQISSGRAHTCAVIDDGTVECWGTSGSIIDSSAFESHVSVPISGLTSSAVEVAAGGGHSCALLDTGTVQCWGYNGSGQLGDNSLTSSGSPVPVAGLTNAVQISAGQSDSCAVVIDGTAVCWGGNGFGQIGNGTTTDVKVPVGVVGIADAVQVTAGYGSSCIVEEPTSVQCWGRNDFGQLGDGTTINSNVPVTVSGL